MGHAATKPDKVNIDITKAPNELSQLESKLKFSSSSRVQAKKYQTRIIELSSSRARADIQLDSN